MVSEHKVCSCCFSSNLMPRQFSSFSSSGNKLAKRGGRRREKNSSSSRTFTKQRQESSARHHGCFLKIGEFFSCDFPLLFFSFFSGIESLCGLRFSCSQGKEEDSHEEKRERTVLPPSLDLFLLLFSDERCEKFFFSFFQPRPTPD